MTKKDIVEQLKRNMPEFSGTEQEIEIKIALYTYVELAKMKAFDERYYYGNGKIRRLAYEQSKEDTKNSNVMATKRKVTCISMSALYQQVLLEFGIENRIIKMNPEDEHVLNEIDFKENSRMQVDVQGDMHNIQTKCRLRKFPIEEPKLTEMLVEIGYIKNEEEYRDEKIEKIKRQVEGLSSQEAVKKILESKEIYEDMKGIGIVEADKYYKVVLRKIRDKELGVIINRFECYRENPKTKEREYTLCICSKNPTDKTVKIYLFSPKEGRFRECDLEKMEELQEEGLKLGKTGKERGIKDVQIAIRNEKEKQREKQSKIGIEETEK